MPRQLPGKVAERTESQQNANNNASASSNTAQNSQANSQTQEQEPDRNGGKDPEVESGGSSTQADPVPTRNKGAFVNADDFYDYMLNQAKTNPVEVKLP